jgi:hypothetical protein
MYGDVLDRIAEAAWPDIALSAAEHTDQLRAALDQPPPLRLGIPVISRLTQMLGAPAAYL